MLDINKMREIKRTDIAIAIFFNFITLGLYSIFWIYIQNKNLNHISTSHRIPNFIIGSCIILWFLSWIYSSGVWSLYWVVKLFLLFELRLKIHTLCTISSSNKNWISAIWLFLFGFLYLIYKIEKFPIHKEQQGNPEKYMM